MIRLHLLRFALVVAAAVIVPAVAMPRPALAQAEGTDPAIASDSTLAADPALEADRASEPATPGATALARKLAALPAEGPEQEIKERSVLIAFYEKRQNRPLWVDEKGLTQKAAAIVREIKSAGDWGLDASAFKLPDLPTDANPVATLDPERMADAEIALSVAILKYARYARGGRIIDPTTLLNSNLDRKPQLIDPETVISDISAAVKPDLYLRELHPKHPQFERLRQALLKTKSLSLSDKLRANMEEWRWMPEDLGDLHILANVPEFMVYLVKNGTPIHSERIVVGELGKQTTIFTRNLKTIVFKPLWRVPDSIKVRELQPDLRHTGGSLFRQHALQLETKDGQPLDYRSIDWSTADIRDYEVVQPPGRKNVMGIVKFTFPSQHTIFMHDTIDKWMFGRSVRTLSHGCLRLRNPMRMAELVLAEDKGWDAGQVEAVVEEGPRNNEIVIGHKIPVHLVYFTAWVDDDGRLRTFRDIYGHEKRIKQALAGKWNQIDVGRNHLAPVKPLAPGPSAAYRAPKQSHPSILDIVGNALSGSF
jgi:murein L,D-transpeptidase YcbB/YkuD